MKNLKLLLPFFILSLHSCYDAKYDPDESHQEEMTTSQGLDFEDDIEISLPAYNSPKKVAVERKIIRNAEIRMQVENVKATSDIIKRQAERYGAYLSEENLENSRYAIENDIIIRVPIDSLEVLVTAVEKHSVFTDYNRVSSTDVTEEFLDIQTRLRTKREVLKRFINILKTEAKTVEEILSTENEIRILTEEIESKEGRLRYLQNKTSFSTLSLNIYRKVDYKPEPTVFRKSFLTKVKEGFVNGWEILVGIILGIINIWPIFLAICLFIFYRKGIIKRLRRRKKE